MLLSNDNFSCHASPTVARLQMPLFTLCLLPFYVHKLRAVSHSLKRITKRQHIEFRRIKEGKAQEMRYCILLCYIHFYWLDLIQNDFIRNMIVLQKQA
ncbi:Uncharacterized protein APZ42_010571 [Daphnia magna]|uniref:Uncharacterized protein n=1 Tax=Daphnia magna TaxID=35525 RepID=A0A164DBI8_9CRUS|nr:Uncharacterized protein APZ42_010571 [Daphnia magna]